MEAIEKVVEAGVEFETRTDEILEAKEKEMDAAFNKLKDTLEEVVKDWTPEDLKSWAKEAQTVDEIDDKLYMLTMATWAKVHMEEHPGMARKLIRECTRMADLKRLIDRLGDIDAIGVVIGLDD